MTHILQYQAVITSLPSAFRFESPPDDSRIVGNPEVMPPIFRKIQAAAVGRTVRNACPTENYFSSRSQMLR